MISVIPESWQLHPNVTCSMHS